MRKLAAQAMALPTIARDHVAELSRRPLAARIAIGIGLATVVGAGAIATSGTAPITATPPSSPVPLTRAAFTSVVTTGLALNEPLTVNFSTPMDEDSVAASLRVQPAQEVDLAWDAGHRTLTIRPADAWRPDTLHSVTVDPGALALTGRPMAKPVRAAFLTRTATDARIEATRPRGERIAIDTGFTITFSRPVTAASVVAGLRADPVMDGTLVATTWNHDGTSFTFTPRQRLPVDTEIQAVPVRRPNGRRRGPRAARLLDVETVVAPRVVRFHPAAKSTGIERKAKLSIRFSQPMDTSTTKAGTHGPCQRQEGEGQGPVQRRRQGSHLQAEEGSAVRRQGQAHGRDDRDEHHRHPDRQEEDRELPGRAEAAAAAPRPCRRPVVARSASAAAAPEAGAAGPRSSATTWAS